MKIGYIRISTTGQNMDRQRDQLTKEGCERFFEDIMTGTKKDRPQLKNMLLTLREGDVVIVTELSRLGRSLKDLIELVEEIHRQGADIKSLKEPWLDSTSPQGKLMFAIVGGMAEFERELIRQRTQEGIASARARGRSGGRPATPKEKIDLALKMYDGGNITVAEITKATGVSKATLYEYLNKRKK